MIVHLLTRVIKFEDLATSRWLYKDGVYSHNNAEVRWLTAPSILAEGFMVLVCFYAWTYTKAAHRDRSAYPSASAMPMILQYDKSPEFK